MTKQEYINWISEIKSKLPQFLDKMKNQNKEGSFKYSLSGDYLNSTLNWGLGNSVFAMKIYYSLCQIPINLPEIQNFIQKFQHKNGEFYDSYVRFLSFPFRTYFALKDFDINRFNHKFIRRAETRQTISALKLFNLKPKYQFSDFPQNKNEIQKFIDNLNWKSPWGAAAHFSALMFLLSVSELENKVELIKFTVDYIQKFRHEDGCWYIGNPTLQQKINGAMKIITGLKAAVSFSDFNNGIIIFDKVTNLIDTALLASNDEHACENFNLTYVLRYANELTNSSYKFTEIENFMLQRLEIYKHFYFPEFGAFSFYKNKTNRNYYGAIITKGKNEPDIHGTVMFIWGLSVIGNFWKINEQIGLQEFVT
jgi:hypothetical protein